MMTLLFIVNVPNLVDLVGRHFRRVPVGVGHRPDDTSRLHPVVALLQFCDRRGGGCSHDRLILVRKVTQSKKGGRNAPILRTIYIVVIEILLTFVVNSSIISKKI